VTMTSFCYYSPCCRSTSRKCH